MASREGKRSRLKAFVRVTLALWALFGLLGFLQLSAMEELEYRTWDWRLRAIAKPPASSPIRIITIDQTSLDYLSSQEKIFWPWPRGVYEVVLRFLERAGARAVAFDILFTEPSSYGVEDDESLSQAVANSLPVVSAVAMRRERTEESEEDISLFLSRQEQSRALAAQIVTPSHAVRAFNGVTLPIRPLLEHSAAFGDVEGAPDRDGVFRHISAVATNDAARSIHTLRLPFALFALGDPSKTLDVTSLVDSEGRLPLRFYGPKGTIETEAFANIFISWQNILAGLPPAIPLERYRDSLVFVGMDAPGLLDLRPTPLAPNFPGVELNATVLQNILDDSFISRLPLVWALLLTSLVIVLMAAVALYLSGGYQAVAIVLVIGAYWGGAFWIAETGWWIPLVLPSIAIVVSLTLCFFVQYLIEGRQHKFIRGAFRHYVSPSIIDQIVADPSSLQLGGDKRELTIFFSDIAGFTTISETLEAKRLVSLMNAYLTAVTDIILRSGGTVDKYMGDAVVAFWNAPLSVPDHALRGVRAALEVQEALKVLGVSLEREYGVLVKTRIGLNTGSVSVGNFGSSARFTYTVIGDAANLASRLEGANKYFGTLVMIAERTFELLKEEVPCRKIGVLKVVGKTQGVTVYEPLLQDSPLRTSSKAETYQRAQSFFEDGRLEEAKALFALLPEDPVSNRYLSRIEVELTRDRSDFTPQWNLTEK